MQLIEGNVRSYAWGSRTKLADLTGRPSPTEHPEAEIWFGAHPAAPSTVVSEDVTLDQFIAADPVAQLGEGHETLPFLLKLLAADKALSLQAHPTKQQAEEGFAAENKQGVPLGAFQRNYKDDNHKPELVVALTDFEALAGFRPVKRTRELLKALDLPELAAHISLLGSGNDESDLRSIFTTWVSLPPDFVRPLIDAVVARCSELLDVSPTKSTASALEEWMVPSLKTVITLSEQYPGDTGILCSLLLNRVTLKPGQALYLDAGQLHAYLGGLAVEIMANSDNVLRSGLTTKHIDVPELMRVLTCQPLDDPCLNVDEHGVYVTPAPEFRLSRVVPSQKSRVEGPAIILSVGDGVSVYSEEAESPLGLAPGRAVWVAASSDPVTVSVAEPEGKGRGEAQQSDSSGSHGREFHEGKEQPPQAAAFIATVGG
ncbi:mannose-6-phosphate isomerase, class I [Corynebacterium anserum]|uniref:mannose-6-phosphate isomerase n=1 Tax=Corynebacterium anserum TaxID=2684406 RepID=A0A7G7YPP6_9CORY|nr:mannose-6-phosphate isomerase, class I [Corynebacterium anserum]MBC2682105.1 mannose-6-phosphate isomerase, class I [Corynebacterium anserum]QNH96466.1 mannose-6-phosphate isomerase, class I [Corynebacterium anserum]